MTICAKNTSTSWRDAGVSNARPGKTDEARQVLLMVEEKEHPGRGHDYNRRITLSTPHAYPIKWVDGRLVVQSVGNQSIVSFGHAGDAPTST